MTEGRGVQIFRVVLLSFRHIDFRARRGLCVTFPLQLKCIRAAKMQSIRVNPWRQNVAVSFEPMSLFSAPLQLFSIAPDIFALLCSCL